MRSFFLFVLVALMIGAAFGGPVTLPSVSVTGVTLDASQVCTAGQTINVSATVGVVYDSPSGPTPTSTNATQCKPGTNGGGNNNCGTGNTTILCKKTETLTTVTVSGQTLTVNGSPASVGSWSGTVTAPSSGDGSQTVSVVAAASDTVTTTTETGVVSYWTTYNNPGGGSCGGSQVGSTVPGSVSSASAVNGPNTATGSATYILDVDPPTVTVRNGALTVQQGGDLIVNVGIDDGSASAVFTLADALGAVATSSNSDTFGTAPHNDGKASHKEDVQALHVACDAPIGTYPVTASLSSANICGTGTGYSVPGQRTEAAAVTPGLLLSAQTTVVSQLTSGDYGIDQCFVSSANKQGKLVQDPGSLHIASIVNTTGPCAGIGTLSGVQIVLTLPAGFSFDKTGGSPSAHVFVGTGSFDLHNPTTSLGWSEVTGYTTQSVSGQTDTITLNSSLGPISAASTIYVRAHATYTGPGAAAADSSFAFSSSASATASTGATLTADPTTHSIVGNPSTYICKDGHPPLP